MKSIPILLLVALNLINLSVWVQCDSIPSHLQLVHPDVHLDPNSIFSDPLVWKARLGQTIPGQQADLKAFVRWALSALPSQVGKTKTSALEDLNAQFHPFLLKNNSTLALPPTYLPFGPSSLQSLTASTLPDTQRALALLLKTNAFYASALTADRAGRLSISSYTGRTFFSHIIRTTSPLHYRYVDAKLADNLTITSFEIYQISPNGTKLPQAGSALDAHEALLVLLNYYSECLHTNLHSFQYLLGSGLAHAADVSVPMNAFAGSYFLNLATTYQAVVDLDLREGGVLVGGLFQANRTALLGVLREVLARWGRFKTAEQFVDEFLFAGFPDKARPRALGLLEQFRRHAELLHSYACNTTAFMAAAPAYQLPRVNQRLRGFMRGTGARLSSVADVRQWLELMSVTGLMHGQTLSFSRLMCTKVAFVAISPGEEFGGWDVQYWRATAPTIVGAQPGRALLTAGVWERESPYYDPKLVEMVERFTVRAAQLKEEYYEEVKGEGNLERDGWLLADFFPDGFDGRQLTITTYL
eukprot:TRINITY_DN757_c0_g1_i1.p1 TRINITY_DN757_c0_g1~~TRINITY_DN757_c0_g1_i1.p1  ORF type:complete len:528 (-),score=75.33 TRINITY_DN757_c0_g1_i1:19-1602(-)